MNTLPIHTPDYSVTRDGISFDGFFLSRIFHNGYFVLAWMSGLTQTRKQEVFDTIEGVEEFLSINPGTLKAFRKVKKFIKLLD